MLALPAQPGVCMVAMHLLYKYISGHVSKVARRYSWELQAHAHTQGNEACADISMPATVSRG